MLKISNLNAGYQDLQVLQSVSFELPQGKIGILMGPNGAGKSTLIKSIFNMVDITDGDISFAGENLRGLATHELLTHGIAYVPQGRINFGTLTVAENLQMGVYKRYEKKDVIEHTDKIYNHFPVLREKKHEYAFSLSGGQQQMLALGRAMMITPRLLLLDEPSLGLSPKLVKEVFRQIHTINKEFGTTILIVEHNIKSVLSIADQAYIMVQGRIAHQDSAQAIQTSPMLQKVFVGEFD